MNRYEQMMIASAYNLRNYCKNTACCNCIFKQGETGCILTTPDNPWNWDIWEIYEKGDE